MALIGPPAPANRPSSAASTASSSPPRAAFSCAAKMLRHSAAALRRIAAPDGDDLSGVRAGRAADRDGERAVRTARLRRFLDELFAPLSQRRRRRRVPCPRRAWASRSSSTSAPMRSRAGSASASASRARSCRIPTILLVDEPTAEPRSEDFAPDHAAHLRALRRARPRRDHEHPRRKARRACSSQRVVGLCQGESSTTEPGGLRRTR